MSPPRPKLILASTSPKRKEILDSLGLKFKSINPRVGEQTSAASPSSLVKTNALLKARSVSQIHPYDFIIAADTVVTSGNKIFLKPKNLKEGQAMLKSYQEQSNFVYTGMTLYEPGQGKWLTRVDKSRFRLSSISTKRQQRLYRIIYSSQQSGGFSIEGLGSILLDRISGSYYNILGLPVHLLDNMFQELGYDLLQFRK